MGFFRKTIAGVVCLGVLAVVAFVGLIWFGKSTAETRVKAFMELASTGTLEAIEKEFHSSVQNKADMQRVALFAKEIATRYGAFKLVRVNGFNFNDTTTNGTRVQEYTGTMEFEKAAFRLHIAFVDGKCSALKLDDEPAIAKEVLTAMSVVPSDTKKYIQQVETLVHAVFEDTPEKAFDLLDEGLQKELGKTSFVNGIKTLPHEPIATLELQQAAPRAKEKDKLDVFHLATLKSGTQIKTKCTVGFSGFDTGICGISIPAQ